MLTSAPLPRSTFTHSIWPNHEAHISAVHPPWKGKCISWWVPVPVSHSTHLSHNYTPEGQYTKTTIQINISTQYALFNRNGIHVNTCTRTVYSKWRLWNSRDTKEHDWSAHPAFDNHLVLSYQKFLHTGKISAYLREFHQCNSQPTSPLLGQCTLTERHFNNEVGIYSPHCWNDALLVYWEET